MNRFLKTFVSILKGKRELSESNLSVEEKETFYKNIKDRYPRFITAKPTKNIHR